MEVYYYINNQEVNRPLNYRQLEIELNYDKDISGQAVSVNEWEWGLGSSLDGKDGAKIIDNYRKSGLSGGVGVFEGLPFRIELVEGNINRVLFNGYLDCSTALYDCDRIVINSTERGNIDWLNDTADSVNFDFLYNKTFTNADFIPVPYVVSELPDNNQAMLSLISMFSVVITIIDQVNELAEDAVTVPPQPLRIALRIAYILTLVFTLASLIRHILNTMIQPVKYAHGMTVKRLCEIGSSHFGFTFESPILDNAPFDKLIIIPEKSALQETKSQFSLFGGVVGSFASAINTNTFGSLAPIDPLARGYYRGTFGELLRGLKEMFNAKILIEGNKLKLVRRDFNNSAPNYILPPVDKTDFRLNAEELKSNYVVKFQTDLNDKNTILKYNGNITQAITTPKGINNTNTVLMKGIRERNIPFARAVRKTALTIPEDIINKITFLIDTVFGNLSSQNPQIQWSPFGNIGDRIGMMLMENDFIQIPKICLVDANAVPSQTKLSANNESIVNSLYLYNNYHFIESFVKKASTPNANQYKIYEKINVPFCFADYEKLRNNNFMKDDEGKSGELLSARWNVEGQVAELEYKINELYTDNLKEEIITPDGR